MNRFITALGGAPAALALVLAGCGSGTGGGGTTAKTPATGASAVHMVGSAGYVGPVKLQDQTGAYIAKTSATPYSPFRTCGACHVGNGDWAKITNSYHFAQGRTNAGGQIQIADNFSAKPWVMTNGMYGKW